MAVDSTRILVLNYNGRGLLGECLPSVVEAAGRSVIPCRVMVVDNGSTDDSLAYLAREWPDVSVVVEPNHGLASFNRVLERINDPVVLLLNNDVKLDRDSVDPLVEAVAKNPDALFAAPACWTFDGLEYEGMRTRVRTRFGLVQGLCRVPGHEAWMYQPDLTASAGPVLAVDRRKFLELGGYDPIYFPGRIEDLDLGFRGWMAGFRGYYVPTSMAWHQGFGTFRSVFGSRGNDRLAARNTLLFAWKNLSGWRLLAHLAWLPLRLAFAVAMRRTSFLVAFGEALARLGRVLRLRREQAVGESGWTERQEAFFRRFSF